MSPSVPVRPGPKESRESGGFRGTQRPLDESDIHCMIQA